MQKENGFGIFWNKFQESAQGSFTEILVQNDTKK